MKNDKVIVAISTPLGTGGISIVRMTGEGCLDVANKVFETKNQLKPRELTLGKFKTKDFNEMCMCVYFKAPKSFTGEDMIEFQCHGGVALANGILNELLYNGASLASNGEFSKRAFLNGKMNLSQAEGMIDMINAESEAEIRAGYELLKGELAQKVKSYQEELTNLLAEIEVSFDYPEEDYEEITKKKAKGVLAEIKDKINTLLKTSAEGKVIKDGVNVLIIGKPNVGKSSLLNALLSEEKAIVTSTAGTTRDIVEGRYVFKGVKFNLIDTAGIHETHDEIENIGINKAKQFISSAEIVLFVVDATKPLDDEDAQLKQLLKNRKYYVLKNKIDAGNVLSDIDGFDISAKNKKGIEGLKEKLYKIMFDDNLTENSLILTNQRHIECLKNAQTSIDSALLNMDNMSLDVVTIDIKDAWQFLGEITGQTSNEEIINTIFSKFCLGK